MRKSAVFLVLVLVTLLVGCQAIFTFSPLSGLKRDPSTMSPEQRLTYAQDALASGDPAAMLSAYNAIKNDTGGDAQYTAAQLGIEISGVPTILREIASDPSTVTAQLNAIDAFITAHNLDPNYMVAAATQLQNAAAAGVPLATMDYAMGAMGIMLGGAMALNGNWDFAGLGGGAAQTAAIAFLAPAVVNVASLPSGDPLKDFITQLNTYISNPAL